MTLIALLKGADPVLGLVAAPALEERYWGLEDSAFMQRREETRAIRASGCTRLGEARLTTTDPALFADGDCEAFDRLRGRARLVRYGLDGYGYARLAAGSIDLVAEAGLKPHDYHALIPLVRGAGGVIGDWEGGQDFEGGRVLAAATPELFDEALALLSWR